jgi:triosephosphate isomerase (TIM)
MKREKIIIANWKMNLTVPEGSVLLEKIEKSVKPKEVEVVICPSFVDIYSAEKTLASSGIEVGAQDVFYEDAGAYTGEVSAHQLRGFAKYAIVGHSERRKHFGEGDKIVAKKAAACVRHEISPIVCVGENLHEKMEGLTKLVVAGQAEASLADLINKEVADAIIAYEPAWAIGTGHVCEPKVAEEVAKNIRNLIKVIHGEKVSDSVRIVYGGSIDENNVKGFLDKENIDGFLIGGSSLKHDVFSKIVNLVEDSVDPSKKKIAPKPQKKKEAGS